MEIREYAELSSRQRQLAAAVDFSDGDAPSTSGRMAETRPASGRLLGYESLYLLEDGIPLAKVGTKRIVFRGDGGEQTVCGITDVVTRADSVRRGYATRLIEEAHRRARAEGLRWTFLWTRRSWGAHGAYERLGYRDVYGAPLAVHRPERVQRPSRRRLAFRVARRTDAALLGRLLSDAARERVGFSRRPRGWFEGAWRHGWLQPAQYRILYAGGRPIGYAHVLADRFDLLSREIVLVDPRRAGAVLDQLEALARGRWIGIATTTFLRDARTELARRRYDVVSTGHGVLMAAPLGPRRRDEERALTAAIASPRFWLHLGDMI